jgi:hypothetical protein
MPEETKIDCKTSVNKNKEYLDPGLSELAPANNAHYINELQKQRP